MTNISLVREKAKDINTILDSLYGQKIYVKSKGNQLATFLGLCGNTSAHYKQHPMTKVLLVSEKGAVISNYSGNHFSFVDEEHQELWASSRKELLVKQNELRKESCKESVYAHINKYTFSGSPLTAKQVSILLRNLEEEFEYLNKKNKEIMQHL